MGACVTHELDACLRISMAFSRGPATRREQAGQARVGDMFLEARSPAARLASLPRPLSRVLCFLKMSTKLPGLEVLKCYFSDDKNYGGSF